jgi:hypothetical protein
MRASAFMWRNAFRFLAARCHVCCLFAMVSNSVNRVSDRVVRDQLQP